MDRNRSAAETVMSLSSRNTPNPSTGTKVGVSTGRPNGLLVTLPHRAEAHSFRSFNHHHLLILFVYET